MRERGARISLKHIALAADRRPPPQRPRAQPEHQRPRYKNDQRQQRRERLIYRRREIGVAVDAKPDDRMRRTAIAARIIDNADIRGVGKRLHCGLRQHRRGQDEARTLLGKHDRGAAVDQRKAYGFARNGAGLRHIRALELRDADPQQQRTGNRQNRRRNPAPHGADDKPEALKTG